MLVHEHRIEKELLAAIGWVVSLRSSPWILDCARALVSKYQFTVPLPS